MRRAVLRSPATGRLAARRHDVARHAKIISG
jgi:hypothetical protein